MLENSNFTRSEINEQRIDVAFYILDHLTDNNIGSIQVSLRIIKKITGLDISLEKAIEIKRMTMLTEGQERPQLLAKKPIKR